jgi:predicted histone-like DNA-binding protein
MEVKVQRYLRRKVAADPDSPLVYHLRQVPGTSETYTLESLAQSIETSSSLTAEDVVHAVRALAREMKRVFLCGNRVKIDGLGIFSLTFNATGVETEKECNVKTINKVNIRFRADRELRLANESTSLVRTGHGVKFAVADTRTRKKAQPQPQAAVQPQKQEATPQAQQPKVTVQTQLPKHTEVQKAPALAAPVRLRLEKRKEIRVEGRKPVPPINKGKSIWSFRKPALTLQDHIKRRKDEYTRNPFETRKEPAGP